MSAVLDFPVLDAPAATGGAIAKIDLKALALSRFGDWKPEAEKVVAKYKGVIFDATTPKGYKSLTEAIAEVRAPRYAAQNVSKASKSELAAVSKAVGSEEAAVAAFLDATEAELVAQKDAEDARRAQETERLRLLEVARVAGFNAKIAAIRECVTKARGLTAERITKGIAIVEAFTFSTEDWAEFAVPAANAQCETLEAMRALLAAAVHDETVEAQRVEQAAEQARVAEEQRVERERLGAERVELARQRAELEAARAAAAPAAPVAAIAQTDPPAGYVAPVAVLTTTASPAKPVITVDLAAAEPFVPAVTEEPTLTLGDIKDRIAPLSITAEGLAQLGFAHAATKGAAKLYLPSAWPAMRDAMKKHLEAA